MCSCEAPSKEAVHYPEGLGQGYVATTQQLETSGCMSNNITDLEDYSAPMNIAIHLLEK